MSMSSLFRSKPSAAPAGTVPLNYSPSKGKRNSGSPAPHMNRLPWSLATMTEGGAVPLYATSGQQFPHFKSANGASGSGVAGAVGAVGAEHKPLPVPSHEDLGANGRRRSMSLSSVKLESDSNSDLTAYAQASDEDLPEVVIEEVDVDETVCPTDEEMHEMLSNKGEWKQMINEVGLSRKQLRSVTPRNESPLGGSTLGLPPAVPRRTTTYETAKLQMALENLPQNSEADNGKKVLNYREFAPQPAPKRTSVPVQAPHATSPSPAALPSNPASPLGGGPPPLDAKPCIPGYSLETKEEKVKKGVELFQWAKYFEACGKLTDSLQLYRQGLDKLHEAYLEEVDPAKMEFLQATMGYHFSRAEEVRALVAQPAPEKKETLSTDAAERLEQAEFHIREARSFDNGNLLDDAILAYQKSLKEFKKMATDPEYQEQRQHVAGRALIIEKRLVKLLKYRNVAAKVLPYPYRVVYDVPNRVVTKTGLGQFAQKQVVKQVEKRLVGDDPTYAKHKAKVEEKKEKKFLKSKKGKKMLKQEAKEAKEREEREAKEAKKRLKKSKGKKKKLSKSSKGGNSSASEDDDF